MQKFKGKDWSKNVEIKTYFGAFKNRSVVQRLSMTGVFFGLVLLFQFLERYMPFGETYLKLNFSLLFILPIFYFAGPQFGIIVLLLRFAIGPSIGTLGYTRMGLVSHFVLLMSSSIAITFLYIFSFSFRKFKKHSVKYILISVSTILCTSTILTFLNGLFFTPLFWYVSHYIKDINISSATKIYKNNSFVQTAHFGIKDYWSGIIAVYFSGNIAKFSLIFFVNYPLSIAIRHYILMGK